MEILRRIEDMSNVPQVKAFTIDGNVEFCRATGDEMLVNGEWKPVYVDENMNVHYEKGGK